MYVSTKLNEWDSGGRVSLTPEAFGRHGYQKAVALVYHDYSFEGDEPYGYLTIDNTRGESKSIHIRLTRADLVKFARSVISEHEKEMLRSSARELNDGQ